MYVSRQRLTIPQIDTDRLQCRRIPSHSGGQVPIVAHKTALWCLFPSRIARTQPERLLVRRITLQGFWQGTP
jgi:hypothetical protein